MELIETLKTQHRLVEEIVTRLDAALAARDEDAAKSGLAQFQTALLVHLKLEDTRLYPELLRIAEARSDVARTSTVRIFAQNMARISQAVTGFLERHAPPRAFNWARLASDWATVKKVLLERIAQEETTLYPLFADLSARG